MSGEMLLAIGYGLVMFICAAFVWVQVRKHYKDRTPE